MFSIQWTKLAEKQLKKIQPLKQRESIYNAVERLTTNPTTQVNVKALKGHAIGFRLRVGRYRVLFDVEDELKIISIEEVKKRNERTY